MRRVLLLLTLLIFVLIGCSGGESTEQPLDARTLLNQAVSNLQPKQTFHLIIDRTGAEYLFQTDLGGVAFERAEGQYVAPGTIGAKVKVILGKLPVEADVYAAGQDQWVRGIWTNMQWANSVIVEGFDPSQILAAEGGLKTAMDSLVDPTLVGEESLEDGTTVYHISATADGADVSALVVNLIQMTGTVNVDVFIDKENSLPVRFLIVQPDTVTDDQPDPTTWTIDLFDFDAPQDVNAPDVAEPTAEVTPES